MVPERSKTIPSVALRMSVRWQRGQRGPLDGAGADSGVSSRPQWHVQISSLMVHTSCNDIRTGSNGIHRFIRPGNGLGRNEKSSGKLPHDDRYVVAIT